ncbi:hypothetical protein DM02DRAFT_700065, partial [Periconia macrospinosa]
RPGELIESDGWKGSNEGLLYKDITLSYQRTPDYTGLVITITLRNRKGHRANSSHKPTIIIYAEPEENRHKCPVIAFLGHALADGVFLHCETFDEINRRRPAAGQTSYVFRMRSDMLDVPVLRSLLRDGTISPTKILTYNCLRNMIAGLGQRAGYTEKLIVYNFRRGYGNAIAKSGNSVAARQMMGNSLTVHANYYAADLVAIDTQALVNGRQPNQQLIEMNICMNRQADNQAPHKLGTRLTDVKTKTSECNVVAPLLSVKQQYEQRRRMRDKNYEKERKAYLREREGLYMEVDPESDNNNQCDVQSAIREPSRYLTALLKHDPDRQKLIDLFYTRSSASMGECVDTLQRMANPAKQRTVYRGVKRPEVAAYCLFCLGDTAAPPHVRCAQHPDTFYLHKHMKKHLDDGLPETCPHPKCEDALVSKDNFWRHATEVHGIPPFSPGRVKRNRSEPSSDDFSENSKKPRIDDNTG